MMRRIINAYVVEMQKAICLRTTYAGPLLVLLAVFAAMLQSPLERDGLSDYRFVYDATTMALGVLGLFLIVIFCSGLIASELGRGSIRLMLVRPLRRVEFLLAKLLLGATFAVLLLLVAGVASWTLAALLGEVHGVEYGGETLYTSAGMAGTYAAAAAFSLFPLLALVAFALLMSTLTRSSAAAIGGSIGLWLLLDLVKNPLGIQPYVFTTYLEPWQVFAQRSDGFPEMGWMPDNPVYMVGVSVLWLVLLVALAAAVLQRRSLHA